MDLPATQVFFDDLAAKIMTPDAPGLLDAFGMPMSLHFEGSAIQIEAIETLEELLQRHRIALAENAVTQLVPMVVGIEPGLRGRMRADVTWHYRADGASRVTPSAYFIDSSGPAPKICMIDFAAPLPARYEAYVFRPE